ncbi:hypothetical protein [Thermococcus sp.]
MITRIRVFNISDGVVVEKVSEFSPKIASGVFRFFVQGPHLISDGFSAILDAMKSTLGDVDVSGIAYGEPGIYFGRVEDISSGEKYLAVVAMSREKELLRASIAVSEVDFGGVKGYFLRGEVYSDILFSPDLKPGRMVAFRGIRLSGIG